MTSTRARLAAAALAFLAVTAVLPAVMTPAAAAGQPADQQTRDARLALEQPDYVDESPSETTINGSQGYVVHGQAVDIAVQNFDPGNVVEYGVASPAGRIEYDASFKQYEFDAEGNTGTFQLYWVVARPVVVENTTTNTTENASSSSTETVIRRFRYEAVLRVDGGANMTHISQSEYEALQARAEKGDLLNTTIQQEVRGASLPFAPNDGSDREIFAAMTKRYVSTGNPLKAFTGRYTSMWVLGVLSLGGALFIGQFLFLIVYLIRKLRKRENEAATKEAVEGDLASRIAELDQAERLQTLANMDWQDILDDDHVAHAFSQHLGDNVQAGWTRFTSAILPEHIVRDRLRLMGVNGWTAVETASDGGTTPGESVRLVRETTVEDDTDTIDLVERTDEVLERVDWDADSLREFDATTADVYDESHDVEFEQMDLDALAAEFTSQLGDFQDEQAYAEYLSEMAATVRDHPYTDSEGRPDGVRHLFGCLFETGQLLDERYQMPLADYVHEHLEAAIQAHDPASKAQQLATEVRNGEHS